MQRSVLTFWQMREDECRFIEFLQRENVIVPRFDRESGCIEFSKGVCQEQFDQVRGCSAEPTILLTREEFADAIVLRPLGNQRVAISSMLSPVIVYEPGRLIDNQLSAANFVAYWEAQTESGWASKCSEFIDWGKRVFRWLKGTANVRREGAGLPMTEAVAKAMDNGLRIVCL